MQRFQIIFFFAIITIAFSCAKDKLAPDTDVCTDEITYQANVRGIINTTCAYSGCHDGSNAPGDYTSYSAMERVLDDGNFRTRVIEIQDMPPNYASGPTRLSDQDLVLMKCWISGGFKE